MSDNAESACRVSGIASLPQGDRVLSATVFAVLEGGRGARVAGTGRVHGFR